MTLVQAFRRFDREILREPMRYIPVATELKGITNLVIGSLQMVTYQLMRCSSKDYYQKLAKRHYEIGTQSLFRGVKEFVPGALAAVSTYLFVAQKE
ncbi:MAG: hypothetical protein K1X28_07290 [Parachlamydiales bacterium]|nr:hypothetical protein [Parachlamydiales bacterium]